MMSAVSETTDRTILDRLRREPTATVQSLADWLGVTATAVRQRLTRLMDQGLVERTAEAAGRGRPTHYYRITDLGRRSAGNNYNELAVALWEEIRSVRDPEVRQGLLQRIAVRVADLYLDQVTGDSADERLASLAQWMSDRDIPCEVGHDGETPVMAALACPYPDLAEQDRGVCAMEKMVFAELVGAGVKLSACRLDGADCCSFVPSGSIVATPQIPPETPLESA